MYVYEYGNVKGFAQAGFRKICWISAIRVDPEYRRHGVAEKLIRFREREDRYQFLQRSLKGLFFIFLQHNNQYSSDRRE